jgi:hypothetical protein
MSTFEPTEPSPLLRGPFVNAWRVPLAHAAGFRGERTRPSAVLRTFPTTAPRRRGFSQQFMTGWAHSCTYRGLVKEFRWQAGSGQDSGHTPSVCYQELQAHPRSITDGHSDERGERGQGATVDSVTPTGIRPARYSAAVIVNF